VNQAAGAIGFLTAMLAAWLVYVLDPWLGIALGVMSGAITSMLVIAAATSREPENRPSSSDFGWDEEEPAE
jgi:uncharacterized transporter YbjL